MVVSVHDVPQPGPVRKAITRARGNRLRCVECDRILEEGRTTGVVRTMFGRRRLVPNLTSRNFQMRSQAERETVNMPIQGTAADILKLAMVRLGLGDVVPGARMILTVHDELVFEVPEDLVEKAKPIIKEAMETALALDVPLEVDVGSGTHWGEAH